MLGFQIKKIRSGAWKTGVCFLFKSIPSGTTQAWEGFSRTLYLPVYVDFLNALVHLKLHQTSDVMHMEGHAAVLGCERHHTQSALLPSELSLG